MAPTPADAAKIECIGQIALSVSDLKRAIAFYRETLELPFLFETGHMAFFDCGGVRIMLSTVDHPGSTYSSILYYKTSDIHAAAKRLESKGVAFESPARLIAKMPDHELWMAFFRDSEGNLLALMSEIR
jgi:methylmalonyl-CoA/ethylmalonyl-CoA epimerase